MLLDGQSLFADCFAGRFICTTILPYRSEIRKIFEQGQWVSSQTGQKYNRGFVLFSFCLLILTSKKYQRSSNISNMILRLPAVKTRTGLSRSTIYLRVAEGRFPQPISLGARAVGWIDAEVEAWLSGQIELSRRAQGGRLQVPESR